MGGSTIHLRFLVFQLPQRELRLKKVELGGMQPEEKDLRQRTKEFALQSRLSPQPVAFYAAVFFFVNVTYILLIWELIEPRADLAWKVRRNMRYRSIATLCLFGIASLVALKCPFLGLAICCCCLVSYLRPGAPGAN